MNLEDLLQKAESKEKKNKRLGRGNGSDKGTYCGRGVKGQKARSGFSKKAFFAGGQTPIIKRIPKHGFSNKPFRHDPDIVNVFELNFFSDEEEVTPEKLQENNFISGSDDGVKILGDGELDVSLQVQAHEFSDSAKEKIEEAGGEAEIIE